MNSGQAEICGRGVEMVQLEYPTRSNVDSNVDNRGLQSYGSIPCNRTSIILAIGRTEKLQSYGEYNPALPTLR